jgi:DNA-binding transcriptional ArsR family regulator
MAGMDDRRQLSDPRVLRAIAHPVRTRILEEMSASGPVRAADVAQSLGIPANQASFHLRQLAKYGMVEEAPEEARDKRDRVWRATSTQGYTVNLKEMRDAPGGRAAVDVFRASKLASLHELIDNVFVLDRPEGSGVFSASDHSVRLTDEEAGELRQEIDDLIESWTARTKGRDPARRTYHVLQVIQPRPTPDAG